MRLCGSMPHNIRNSRRRTVTIYTDSKVTIQSIKNYRNHKSLIEKIRKKALELEKKEWTIQITWIKAHVGNYGNELADRLAKEATKNKETIYKKIPKSQIVQQVKQQSIEKWQTQWEQTTKGRITKQFFPNIKERLGKKNSTNTQPNSNSDSPRKNKGLFTQIQNNRLF